MPKPSAGILLFRLSKNNVVEVLIVHPGGPFWAKKDDGAWSIPKGEYLDGEDAYEAALREFREELGSDVPRDSRFDLGELKQSSGKRLHVWATEGDLDSSATTSNLFEMEWPPKSGKTATFPEVDRAAWESIAVAKRKLLKGQVEFLANLMDALGQGGVDLNEGVDDSSPSQSDLF
jgi:predicted NUDIX family NTP pyrophosphohydrolase